MPASRYRGMTVGDVMAPSPVAVRPGSTLAAARALMDESDIRHLPVVDGDGRVLGILSHRDLVRAEGRGEQKVTVGELMTENVLVVAAGNRLCEASELMLDHKIGALPVVDGDDVLVGIITETDFLRIAHIACGGDVLVDAKDD